MSTITQDENVDLESNVTVVQIVVQATQLEVIVTDHDQSTVTFNKDSKLHNNLMQPFHYIK